MIDIIIYMFKFMSSLVNFQAFQLKKLNELFEKRVFEIINIKGLFIEARVFKSRFIN